MNTDSSLDLDKNFCIACPGGIGNDEGVTIKFFYNIILRNGLRFLVEDQQVGAIKFVEKVFGISLFPAR